MNKEFLAKKKDIDELKNGKVDKEEGKGLSQNDFTNIHKEAVEAIPEELQQKADLFHTHSKSDINDLDSALNEKLNIASRNYVPVRYVSESKNFDTDFQLTSTDPNKVIFTNTKSVLNSNSPMGIPMPYMLTVERLYVNGASNYFRQTFTGLMNAGSESAYIVEYQRLYIYTANPFWTDWKECDAAPLWSDITDKPETFPPEAHKHEISDVDNLDSVLSEKLSIASRSYVPIRSVTESANFNTDFQLTDDDPNKVVFINTRATGNTNIPTGIPMPYMLTVDRLYSNGNYYVLRQSFTGLSNYAVENAKVIEYERLYVCVTTNPFWTDWKKCDTAVLDTKFDTAGSGLTADGTTIKHTDIYSSTGFGNYHQQKYITWGDTISVPWGSVNSSGHLTTSGTVDVVLPEPLWSDITDKPGTFPPSDHNHSIGDINNLDSTLNGKLSVSSRNYVPVRYVSESKNFNIDFQLTSTDPNKVIFTNTKSVINTNDPTGVPMPYMLTVERLYVNGASNYFRQTFTGMMNPGSDSAYIVEYQRLYINTANPFWTDWKAVDSGEDDHKVIQEYVAGADYEYPILCSTDTEHTQSTTTDKTLKILGMTINPKAGTITAQKFKGALEGRASSADSVEWGNVSGKPETFPPETHSHNYAASSTPGGVATRAVSDSKGVNIAGQFEDVRNDIALNRTALGTQCKNLLKLTLTTKTVSGITFTVNDDYSITLNGTSTAIIWQEIGATGGNNFRKEKLIFTGNPAGTGSGAGLEAWYMNSTTGNKYVSIANGNILTESDYDPSGVISYEFHINQGKTYNNVTFYPMLRYADITDGTYEPYQPSLQEQINQLSDTSNSGKLLYSMSEVVSSPLTVNITGLFTAYTVVVCNVLTSNNGKHSLTLPLKYIKSLGTSTFYEANGILFYYVDDNKIKIATGLGQSNPTINDVKIISLF